jgi:dynein intermediate chain 1
MDEISLPCFSLITKYIFVAQLSSVASEHDQPIIPAFQEPIRRIIKPENQLELTDQELGEDITRILTGDDPNVPKNVCKFSFKDKCYKPDPPGQGDNMAIHFSLQGSSMHVDSEECKKYREREAGMDDQAPKAADPDAKFSSEGQTTTTTSSGTSTVATGTTKMQADHTKNQFNYSERASQTFNIPLKSRGVHTEPPPITQFSEQVNQWMIFDSYKNEYLISMMEHNKQEPGSRNISFEDKLASIVAEKGEVARDRSDMMHSEDMENALKIMGRLVNQNAEDEIFQDFKYYEDPADPIKQGQGTLLPLWRFSTDRTNRKQVTSLCWNPLYNDLFAVGYGSYEFTRQGTGTVCCYSLKNTSYPEYVIGTESGVMCLDFHPNHPSLLAVGCYDGSVSVYDIGNRSKKPIYNSSIRSGKHSDPVWQVRWHDGGSSKEMNFYSISTDGKVAIWTMSKNELKMEPVMYLKLTQLSKEELDEPTLTGLAGGSSFDFNRNLENLFLVGTEEGNIHECSKAYSGQYINSYEGHHMGVHAVKWNPFHEDIFISCSADWTVKVSLMYEDQRQHCI